MDLCNTFQQRHCSFPAAWGCLEGLWFLALARLEKCTYIMCFGFWVTLRVGSPKNENDVINDMSPQACKTLGRNQFKIFSI